MKYFLKFKTSYLFILFISYTINSMEYFLKLSLFYFFPISTIWNN